MLVKGIKSHSNPKQKKQPVTPAFLGLLRRSLDLNQPRQRLWWGSVVIGFFFLLRRSENLQVGHNRHAFLLKDCKCVLLGQQRQKNITCGCILSYNRP